MKSTSADLADEAAMLSSRFYHPPSKVSFCSSAQAIPLRCKVGGTSHLGAMRNRCSGRRQAAGPLPCDELGPFFDVNRHY